MNLKNMTAILILAMIMAICSYGALAFESVSKWGMTDGNQFWISGTMGTAPYIYNWTDVGQDANMPLVYDLNNDGVNEIIQSRSGTIKIYYANGSVITSQYISGLDSRQISAFDSDICPSGKGLYVVLSNGDMSLQCLVNNVLIEGWLCDETAFDKNVPDFTGASVSKVDGHNLAVFYYTSPGSHYARFCDDTNSSKWEKTLSNTDAKTWKGTPPHGNLKNDGKEYWVFPYFTGLSVGFTYINKFGNVTSIGIITSSASQDPTQRTPIVVKRGSGSADELLIPYVSVSGIRLYWYGDATGYNYAVLGGHWNTNSEALSQAVQLGTSGDICWWSFLGASNSNWFTCMTPANTSTSYNQDMSILGTSVGGSFLTASDMNNDGYSDFFVNGVSSTFLCLYINHTSLLSCTALPGGRSDYAYGIDIGNDGYRDIIMSDTSNNLLRVMRTNSSAPVSPCTNVTCGDLCSGNTSLLVNGTCLVNGTGYICAYDPLPCAYGCLGNQCLGNNQTNCTDTDTYHYENDTYTYPSINYTIGGTMSYGGQNYFDYCENYTTLREMYCQNVNTPIPQGTSYNCGLLGMVCQNGGCHVGTNNSCTDTDTQAFPSTNYYVKGTTTSVVNQVPTNSSDYCLDANTLKEYYCQAFTNTTIFSLNYNCAVENKSCVGGQCTGNCNLPVCSSPCMFYDDFSYSCTLYQAGWSIFPYNYSISPVGGQLCYNDLVSQTEFGRYLNPTHYADVMTQEFNLTLPNTNNAGFTTQLRYYDGTDKEYHVIYFMDIYYTDNITTLAVWEKYNGQPMTISLGTGVLTPGQEVNIKIVHYNFDTLGRTFFNTTTNHTGLILPNTYAIIINNDIATSFFNLPQYEPLIEGHSNLVNKVTFAWSKNNCIDELRVYDGTNFNEWDLLPPTSNVSDIQGCFNARTGAFECYVSSCQSCCESMPNGSMRVSDFGCTLGKYGAYQLNKVRDWILDNIIAFIVLLLVLILLIPIMLKILEIYNMSKGY